MVLILCMFQFGPEFIHQHPFQVNIMKELPAGCHLYGAVHGNCHLSPRLIIFLGMELCP